MCRRFKTFVGERSIEKTNIVPIKVGNGETIFSEGTAILTLNFQGKDFYQKALVVQTDAFEAVLGTDFLANPRVGGNRTHPPSRRLLVDNEQLPLNETVGGVQKAHRNFRMFKKESYPRKRHQKRNIGSIGNRPNVHHR